MWLGPVFQAELLTLSRRARFFWGRALYGILILIVVSSTYRSMAWPYRQGSQIPIAVLASFGQAIFSSFAVLQGVIVLAMTPSLVAGAIAEEKQRKTLHYIMASQLTSPEIILGKVASRLLRVGVLGAIGLPVLSMLSLFGGVDFAVVLLVYAATATTTYFMAGLSILCSVFATKPRDAIVQAYFFEFAWLAIAPSILGTLADWAPFWKAIGEFCLPAIEWVAASSPTYLIRNPRVLMAPSSLLPSIYWMMGLQVLYGSLLIAVAAWRLRPAFRGMDGPGLWAKITRRTAAPSRQRLWTRPAVGDDAMLWKEMHLHRVSDIQRVFLIVLLVGVVGFTGYTVWDVIRDAAVEVYQQGYWNYGRNQQELNGILRGANGVIMVVLLVGLGAVSAASVASEREGDTWTNLTSSPIDGLEFIRGKILGCLWLFRPLYYLLAVCWLFGVALGSVHPVGVLIGLVELAIFTWFVASLGVALSLRSRNTVQSLTATIGILLFLNVGYLFFFALVQVRDTFQLFGCTPFLFGAGLVGINDLTNRPYRATDGIWAASCFGMLLYTVAAVLLTLDSIGRYDAIVDRPDRFRNDLTPETLRKIREIAAKPPGPFNELA